MISWTITVPPTVGTAYETGSGTGAIVQEAPEGLEDYYVYDGTYGGDGFRSTKSNGDVEGSGNYQYEVSFSEYLNFELAQEGVDNYNDSGAFTQSWNGEGFPNTYETSGYTSGTRTSVKQTSTTAAFTWRAHGTTTTSATIISGTTKTATSDTETITVATTTQSTTQRTATSSSVANDTRNATTTATDTVTAYGNTVSVSTTTETISLGQPTTTQTSVSRPPTNTGFRHTATVISLEGDEILWKPTTSGRGALSVICESYDAGRHTINRLTTAVLGEEIGTDGNFTIDVTTDSITVTQSVVSTQSTTVVPQGQKAFPGATATTAIVKLSSTTVTSTTSGRNVSQYPVRTTTVYSTRSTQINVDGVQVPTTALTTSESTFTITAGTTASEGATTIIQPWTWAKLFQAPGVGGAKAFESQYLHGRGAPAGSVVGSQAKAGTLSFTAPTTALNNQTVVAAYPTSWTQSEETKTSTISVNGTGVTISTENSTTSGSSSNEWQVEGQATHQALVSERISPAGRAPKGNITAFYGPGLFYTSANGSTGTVSVANFSTSQVDSSAIGRTAYRPAPLYEIGYLTYDGGSYFVTTTRYDSNIVAESSIML